MLLRIYYCFAIFKKQAENILSFFFTWKSLCKSDILSYYFLE